MNKHLRNILTLFITLVIVVLPLISYAEDAEGEPAATGSSGSKIFDRSVDGEKTTATIVSGATGLGKQDPISITSTIISSILTVLGIIAVVMIIYGGFTWMFSRGKDDEVKDAIDILKAAVIGLLVILASYGIALYVFSILEGATGQAT